MSNYRTYFVSYAFYGDTAEGFGTATVTRAHPVIDRKDILSMEDAVRKQSPLLRDTQITVINWRRFENPE